MGSNDVMMGDDGAAMSDADGAAMEKPQHKPGVPFRIGDGTVEIEVGFGDLRREADPEWASRCRAAISLVDRLHDLVQTLSRMQRQVVIARVGSAMRRFPEQVSEPIDRMYRTLSSLRDILAADGAVPAPPRRASVPVPRRKRLLVSPEPVPATNGSGAGMHTAEASPAARGVIAVSADAATRQQLMQLLLGNARQIEVHENLGTVLVQPPLGQDTCLLIDGGLPEVGDSTEVFQRIRDAGHHARAIMLVDGDAAQQGLAAALDGVDIVTKPIDPGELFAAMQRARQAPAHPARRPAIQNEAPFDRLTPQERRVTKLVVAGHPNKRIALLLGISRRTVEHHRQAAMQKLGTKSLCELVRFAMAPQATDAEPARKGD